MGDTGEKSEFNIAYSWINSINQLLWVAANHRSTYDIQAWHNCLQILSDRLYPQIIKSKYADDIKRYEKDSSYKVQQFSSTKGRRLNVTIPNDLYELLRDFERALITVADDSGLLIKTLNKPTKTI